MEAKTRAAELLQEFKGDHYSFGFDNMEQAAAYAREFGTTALLIGETEHVKAAVDEAVKALADHGVALAGGRVVPGAAPNAPREDVYRLESYILHFRPDVVIVIGGGSGIDAAKAANVLAGLGEHTPEIEAYFGMGLVTEALQKTGRRLLPLVAVQTAASSGAHLTKYANVTDIAAGQKKLIVDEAVIPDRAVFDYGITSSMPIGLTIDGALDGMAHMLEVFYGAKPDTYDRLEAIAGVGLELIIRCAPQVIAAPEDRDGREALGLATDLGGYAIMVGGTSGPHLTSFSLVDITSHGRACGVLNPYYTVFFAPAIQKQLQVVGGVLQQGGHIPKTVSLNALSGRDLGLAVAEGMISLGQSIDAPTRLKDIPGFTEAHIERALTAAKNPQLEMKLKNMPVPLDASQVDQYMGPILYAAAEGDFQLIRSME